jgi:hypothetical protein
MTQERALEIAQSIWGDIAVAKINPREGQGSYEVGWEIEAGACSWFYGDDWEDAFDTVRKCVSQKGWPDPYNPQPDEAAYILQRLGLAGFVEKEFNV